MTLPALDQMFQREEFVVVRVVDGLADTSVLHLPATEKMVALGRADGLRPVVFDELVWSPMSWPSACGRVEGPVYVRGGLLARVAVCKACAARHGTRKAYNLGCRCDVCLGERRRQWRGDNARRLARCRAAAGEEAA